MKLKILLYFAIIIVLTLALQSSQQGRAFIGGQDMTGAPGSNGTCGACHSSNGMFGTPQVSIDVKDMNGTTVSSYIPGAIYDIEFTISAAGTPAGFGMQGVVLDSAASNIGDMLVLSSPNTRLVTLLNGREIIEQKSLHSTGVFGTTWQAPAAGSDSVTIYGIGLAANGSFTSGDNISGTARYGLSEAIVNTVNFVEGDVNQYKVYPIPNNGDFYIHYKGINGVKEVKMIDVHGVTKYQNKLDFYNSRDVFIQTNALKSGVYFLEIKGSQGVQTLHVLVQ